MDGSEKNTAIYHHGGRSYECGACGCSMRDYAEGEKGVKLKADQSLQKCRVCGAVWVMTWAFKR